jgi:N-glycosidase YbiA
MIGPFRGEYRFLSNFWAVKVGYEGILYPSVEHAYQAAKTLDQNMRRQISALARPGDAKRIGRQVVMRHDWYDVRLDVMLGLTRAKYADAVLARKLLDTGDQPIVEENTWGDRFWGVCGGRGENHLGIILMRVRAELRGEKP